MFILEVGRVLPKGVGQKFTTNRLSQAKAIGIDIPKGLKPISVLDIMQDENKSTSTVEIYQVKNTDNFGNTTLTFLIKNNSYMPVELKFKSDDPKNNKNIDWSGKTIVSVPKREAGKESEAFEAFTVKTTPQAKQLGWSMGRYTMSPSLGHSQNRHNNNTYRFPFNGSFSLSQGENGTVSHNDPTNRMALDFTMPLGTEVKAMRSGIVIAVKQDSDTNGAIGQKTNEANYVHILHEDGSIAKYVHLLKDGAKVVPGDKVKEGQTIGLSGNTGSSTGPHLHVQVDLPKGFSGIQYISMQFQSMTGNAFKPQVGEKYSSGSLSP